MRTNVPVAHPPVTNHEGVRAVRTSALGELRRMTLSALLFEDTFYESGAAQAKQVAALVPQCAATDVAQLAIECRTRMHLRHMPLFLVRELARVKGNGAVVAATLPQVILRPDELCEYLALYWKDKRQPVSAGSKRGLAAAFKRFDAATLAKYDRDNAVKLRDVLRITHSKPSTTEQAATWKAVVKRELAPPDTWEVALSGGADKKATFERLLRERKLGGLAFLRNLRNMVGAKVDEALLRERFAGGFGQVLPFRFLAALKHAPSLAAELDGAMLRAMAELPKLAGTTVILIDVSPSMHAAVSAKSDITREDAAVGVAILAREVCAHARVFSFSTTCAEVPAFRGLGLVKPIKQAVPSNGTLLGRAMDAVNAVPHDRLIVITDEESQDEVKAAKAPRAYMVNVATYGKGIGYGPWVRINGWSERVLDFIVEHEREQVLG